MKAVLVTGHEDVDIRIDQIKQSTLFSGDNIMLCDNSIHRGSIRKYLRNSFPESIMLFGHGSPKGLFNSDFSELLINSDLVNILRNRQIVGQWCYASQFAHRYRLTGYFSSMYISNNWEANDTLNVIVSNDEVYELDLIYMSRLLDLIQNHWDKMAEWPDMMRDIAAEEMKNNPIVKFNYEGLEYFDGVNLPRSPRRRQWDVFRNGCCML